MKKVGIAVLVVVGLVGGLVVAAGVALYTYAGTEYTVCYGIFKSRGAAERAADAAGDVDLDTYVDHRASESAVEFETGETGDDAREARRDFPEIVKREHGILGHPGGGCLERGPFDH